MANKLKTKRILINTFNSGAALSCRYVKFRFNYAPLDSVENFDLYKLVNGAFITLTNGPNSDWVMEGHRDGNWYVMIRNTDASRSGPEMLNGIYVLRNRETRKGKIITVSKNDEACDSASELVYANFIDMNSVPYVSTISIRVTGKIEEELTLNVLDKEENELASVVGGARLRRGQSKLESVTNTNLEAKVVCTSSPCVYVADLVTQDGVFYLNNNDDISVNIENPSFTQSVTMREVRESLYSVDTEDTTETEDRRRTNRTNNRDTTVDTDENNDERPPPSRGPTEDPRVAILERTLTQQSEENRRIMERLNQSQQTQQSEEEMDTTTKILIGAIAVGGIFFIYKKIKDRRAQQ